MSETRPTVRTGTTTTPLAKSDLTPKVLRELRHETQFSVRACRKQPCLRHLGHIDFSLPSPQSIHLPTHAHMSRSAHREDHVSERETLC